MDIFRSLKAGLLAIFVALTIGFAFVGGIVANLLDLNQVWTPIAAVALGWALTYIVQKVRDA